MTEDVDISFQRNETWVRELTFTDGVGDPIDLTGATFLMKVKYSAGDPGAAIADGGVAIVGPATDGVLRVDFDGADFAAVPGDQELVRLAYDLIATQDGLHFCLMRGVLNLEPGVS